MNDNQEPNYRLLLREALGELEELAVEAARARHLLDNPALESSQVLYEATNWAREAAARLRRDLPDEMEPAF